MTLKRYSCDSAECFHGSLTWLTAKNSHVNELITDGFCVQKGLA